MGEFTSDLCSSLTPSYLTMLKLACVLLVVCAVAAEGKRDSRRGLFGGGNGGGLFGGGNGGANGGGLFGGGNGGGNGGGLFGGGNGGGLFGGGSGGGLFGGQRPQPPKSQPQPPKPTPQNMAAFLAGKMAAQAAQNNPQKIAQALQSFLVNLANNGNAQG